MKIKYYNREDSDYGSESRAENEDSWITLVRRDIIPAVYSIRNAAANHVGCLGSPV